MRVIVCRAFNRFTLPHLFPQARGPGLRFAVSRAVVQQGGGPAVIIRDATTEVRKATKGQPDRV